MIVTMFKRNMQVIHIYNGFAFSSIFTNLSLIKYLLFNVPNENLSLQWKR
jgi:hypothetical protein